MNTNHYNSDGFTFPVTIARRPTKPAELVMSASPAPVDACFGSRIVAIDGVKREVLTLEDDPQFKSKRLSDRFDLSNPFVTPALFVGASKVGTTDSARVVGAASPGSDDSLGTSASDLEVRRIMRSTEVELCGLASPAQSGQACFGWRWYRSSELSEPIRVVTVGTVVAAPLNSDMTGADGVVHALASGGDKPIKNGNAEHVPDAEEGRSVEAYTPGHLYVLAHFRTNNLTEKVPAAQPSTTPLVALAVFTTHIPHIRQHTNQPIHQPILQPIDLTRRGAR